MQVIKLMIKSEKLGYKALGCARDRTWHNDNLLLKWPKQNDL